MVIAAVTYNRAGDQHHGTDGAPQNGNGQDRRRGSTGRTNEGDTRGKKRVNHMKKIGIAGVVLGGMIGGLLGLAAPAEAIAAPTVVSGTDIASGIDHHAWLDQIRPKVNVPNVDTTVRHSEDRR